MTRETTVAQVEDFWELFTSSGSPMLVFDDQGVYEDVNPAACRLLGRSREEIVGHAITEITAPSRVGDFDEAWSRFLADRHTLHTWSLTDAAGREIVIRSFVSADVPDRGRHLAVLLASGERPQPRTKARLSPREREITDLLARGLSGEAIARELFLSPETVRTHIRNAMEHVGARTRAHLVAVALRDGLIEAEPR